MYKLIAICSAMALFTNTAESLEDLSKFAIDFYWESASASNENIIISPYSVAAALALLSQGAKGKTFDQIANGLHLPNDKNNVSDLFHQLTGHFEKTIESVTVNVANKIYVKQEYKIKDNFKQVAVKKFHSDIDKINFADSTTAANEINRWVESKTNDKIKNLIDSNNLNNDTRLVLVNAIYFKGKWEHEFKKENTFTRDFFINENDKVSTKFMNQIQSFYFGELSDIDATAILLPYKNSDVSFTIILPNKRNGLSSLENKIKNLKNLDAKLHKQNIDLYIPKLKMEYKIKLNDVLKKLGITNIFGNNADLGDLLDSDERLRVSDVIHEAFMKVGEESTEDAAATGFQKHDKLAFPMAFDRKFVADHPFLFCIRYSNVILFSGRVIHF